LGSDTSLAPCSVDHGVIMARTERRCAMDSFDVLDDLAGLALGDARLDARVRAIVRQLATSPSSPLPELFPDESDLTAVYRMTGRPHVTDWGVLAPHIEATARRVASVGEVLVVHDTTEFAFDAPGGRCTRQHLSKLSSRRQGFLAHVSLAVSDGPAGIPLGVLHLQPFVHRSQVDDAAAVWWAQRGGVFSNEHTRWPEGCGVCEDALSGSGVRPIHVADREGDSTEMLRGLLQGGSRFVIRCSSPHRVVGTEVDVEETTADAVAGGASSCGPPRTVTVRAPRPGSNEAEETETREAALQVRFRAVSLRGPRRTRLPLYVVEVFEPAPPDGMPPVRWLLYTSEPVTTEADAWTCVDRYRRRWLVEEWFKAVKTGVNYEARQLESAHALLNFLAFSVYVATQMLLLRALHRASPELPAAEIMDEEAIAVVAEFVPKAQLHARSTLGAVLSAIAAWGGHQKRNGAPGWLTLFRGYAKLLRSLETMRVLGVARRTSSRPDPARRR
jgi:hypothetical protein